MARMLSEFTHTGRLGGRIEPKKTSEDKKDSSIWSKPEKLNDRILRKRVCGDGAKCKGCECLDKCNYGKEFVKRGL